ncbi:guanine nucleotide exchange factor [Anaeramoeba flamelloides]|uniref:Guanine nucleotide exchange factor n=1 Tax=Anaeramoeba flamelloides TaxID=1746091 RepID=A0AAV7YA37_9EUKA|nr:guanine nucleotide exchange factor [Anaeramoeba flamelloides]
MHLTESKEFEKKKTDTRKNKKIHLLSNIRNITPNGNRIERMSSFLMSNFVPKSDFKGKFLKPSTKIIKYAKSKLEFRELPQKEIEIEIISHLPKFKSNIKSFSTNYSLDHIFDYYQSKDSLINSEEFGIVITKQDNFKKDIFKIIPNNELSKKEIQKNFLENSHRFGVWAKPNKKYCLGGYLSKLGNKYDTVQFGRKPSFVTVFLPDQRKIEILVDFNCKVKLIIQKLVDQFSLKTQTIKNEISHEVKYLLFHIEYANENGKLIESQLIKINQEQSLEFQGIYQFTSIKMIKINVPAPKKNNIHNASSNTNIWKEFRQNHQNLTWWKRENNSSSTSIISKHNDFLFNRISGISLNKLIELVTSAGYQTEEFIEIFLELLPSYSNESILLDRLIERFDVPSLHPKTQRTFLEEEKLDIQILTLNLIIKLIENKQHFLPVKVKTKLKTFIQSELINNFKNKDENNKNKNSEKPNYEKNQTINKYIKKIDVLLQNNSTNKTIYTNQQKFRNSSLKIKKKRKVRKLSQINLDKINFQNVNVTQLAKQISLNTHDIFSKITSRELFNKAWTRRDKNEKAPNLTKLINKFNFYADWASTAILEEKTNSKKRLEIYEKMILLAHQFYKLNNFQDMFAILSGLQSAPVSRLFNMKRDLSKKCIKKYNTLLKLTDVTNGCKNLREHTAKSSLPAMPYVGIITTDLTHIHELPDFVDNNLFNWRKRMRIYEVIVYLRKFKQVGYNFIYISAIHNFLDKQKILDEDSMWDISFEIKPHPMDL